LVHLRSYCLDFLLKHLDLACAGEYSGLLLFTVLTEYCFHVFELLLLGVHLFELFVGLLEHLAKLDVVFKISGRFAKSIADFGKAVLNVFIKLMRERVQVLT